MRLNTGGSFNWGCTNQWWWDFPLAPLCFKPQKIIHSFQKHIKLTNFNNNHIHQFIHLVTWLSGMGWTLLFSMSISSASVSPAWRSLHGTRCWTRYPHLWLKTATPISKNPIPSKIRASCCACCGRVDINLDGNSDQCNCRYKIKIFKKKIKKNQTEIQNHIINFSLFWLLVQCFSSPYVHVEFTCEFRWWIIW